MSCLLHTHRATHNREILDLTMFPMHTLLYATLITTLLVSGQGIGIHQRSSISANIDDYRVISITYYLTRKNYKGKILVVHKPN